MCGEGGEYETLTLDCPLFRRARIVLDTWHVVRHSMDSVAPVGVLCATGFHLVSKSSQSVEQMAADVIDVPLGKFLHDATLYIAPTLRMPGLLYCGMWTPELVLRQEERGSLHKLSSLDANSSLCDGAAP